MIDNMDNGTIVGAFKYLNYCQLAKNRLVSVRFRSVIQTHRHKLALLYVSSIQILSIDDAHVIAVFEKRLSSDAYNDWVIQNHYSKEVPFNDQVDYPSNRESNDSTTVFFARAELNHENWPLFQHFVRLVTDPFIYIVRMSLYYQIDVLDSLSETVNPNRRLQCNKLRFDHNGNTQRCLTWIKDHMRCNQLEVNGKVDLNQDEALIDFFMTGGHCTSVFGVGFWGGFSKTVDNFVQKFMDLKNSDDSQLVDAIHGSFFSQDEESLKHNYANFVVKDENSE